MAIPVQIPNSSVILQIICSNAFLGQVKIFSIFLLSFLFRFLLLFPSYFCLLSSFLGMISFSRFCALLVLGVCAAHALGDGLSDDVVSSYANAFAQYQINFDKHYGTQEEYNKRLRAYAVCFFSFFRFHPNSSVYHDCTARYRFQWKRSKN